MGDWRAYETRNVRILALSQSGVRTRELGIEKVHSALANDTLFRGDAHNQDTGFSILVGSKLYRDSLAHANYTLKHTGDETRYEDRIALLFDVKRLCETAILLDTETLREGETNQDRALMHKFYSVAKIDGRLYLVVLNVDEFNSNERDVRRAYDLNSLKMSPIEETQVYKPAASKGDTWSQDSTISIAKLHEIVKAHDKDFQPRPISPELLNKDGTPKTFYHGTKEQFTIFDPEMIGANYLQDEEGFFFTDSEQVARRYADTTSYGEKRRQAGNVYSVYLSLQNPLVLHTDFDAIDMWDNGHERYLGQAKKGNNDGIIIKPQKGDGLYVVFDNTQIKSATDNIGTFDRYAKTRKDRFSQ